MKAVELARVAAAAEAQRIRLQIFRYGRQAAFLAVAGLFGLFALAFVHVFLWMVFAGPFNTGRVWASVIVLGFDVVVAGVLLLLGRGKLPAPAEVEARITRDRSISELKSALAMTAVSGAVAGPAGRFVGRTAWSAVRGVFRGKQRRR